MKNSTKIIVSILVLLCISLGFFVYSFYTTHKQPHYSKINPVETLKKENQSFNTANAFKSQHNYPLALEWYKKSLAETTDPRLKSQIKFYTAVTLELNGSYIDAIKLFKEVILDQSGLPITRAYSVQEVGRMYRVYFASTTEIEKETFTGIPFESLKAPGNISLSYRKLFEYGAAIYPIALSESYIAQWYSHDLYYIQKSASTTPQGVEDIAAIGAALQKSDTYMEISKNDPTESTLFAEISGREAIVVGQVVPSHVPGYSNERAEALYKKSILYSEAMSILPGSFYVYQYAAYLGLQFGAKRADDINKLLTVFTVGNTKNINPNVISFYQSLKVDKNFAADHNAIVTLSQISLSFKGYLTALGWHDNDFTTWTI